MDVEQTEQFAIWITERRDLLAQILRLTLQQQDALQAGLVDRLLATLEDKDAQVNRLKELQGKLKAFAEVAPEERRWASESMRLQCRREIEETERMQKAILEVDARCEQTMLLRRDELFQSIQQTTGVAQATHAYEQGSRSIGGSPSAGGSIDFTSG